MKTCFLFPGQGAQYPGMGKDLWEASAGVKALFDSASGSINVDMKKLLFEGTEEELKATDKTQIAITLMNLSCARMLKEKGLESDGAAGFSLGEYSALVEAGCLGINDVFPLVKARGDIMEKVAKSLDSGDGPPGMAAVIGLTYEALVKALDDAGISGLYPANYNSPVQIVVSGTSHALQQGEEVLKKAGAKRYIRLKVSAPFHSPLLEQARIEFSGVLHKTGFHDPQKPVYSNVTGKKITSAEEARDLCIKQITSTVLWVEEEQTLVKDGYVRCVEAGPGTVLTGLWKNISDSVPCHPAGTLEQIKNL